MALVPFPSASPTPPDPDEPLIELTDADELENGGAKMSFLEHLDELRNRLIACAWALGVSCLIAYIFINRIFTFVMHPLQELLPDGGKLVYTEGPEAFMLYVKIGGLAGLMLAVPFILWQLWLFISPGLYTYEKKFAVPFVLFSTIFFFLGAVFSHYVAFPWTWKFFISFQTDYMQFMPKIGPAFSLYVKMMLGFGLIFQMPTLVFFLSRMGLVSARLLTRHFKYAVLVIFIIAAVISPGTDVMSQLMMAIPMLGLYALSILVAFFFGKSSSSEAA
jgi:sec-independent protein translocase protein TatC